MESTTNAIMNYTLQYLSPARPNGIALHDIITTAHVTNDSDYTNLTVSMEIVPSSCDYDIPLINVTVIDAETTPGMSHALKTYAMLFTNFFRVVRLVQS